MDTLSKLITDTARHWHNIGLEDGRAGSTDAEIAAQIEFDLQSYIANQAHYLEDLKKTILAEMNIAQGISIMDALQTMKEDGIITTEESLSALAKRYFDHIVQPSEYIHPEFVEYLESIPDGTTINYSIEQINGSAPAFELSLKYEEYSDSFFYESRQDAEDDIQRAAFRNSFVWIEIECPEIKIK